MKKCKVCERKMGKRSKSLICPVCKKKKIREFNKKVSGYSDEKSMDSFTKKAVQICKYYKELGSTYIGLPYNLSNYSDCRKENDTENKIDFAIGFIEELEYQKYVLEEQINDCYEALGVPNLQQSIDEVDKNILTSEFTPNQKNELDLDDLEDDETDDY